MAQDYQSAALIHARDLAALTEQHRAFVELTEHDWLFQASSFQTQAYVLGLARGLAELDLNSERYLWLRNHAVRIQGSELWYQGAALDIRDRMAEQAKSVQEGGMRLLKRQPE